MAGIEPAPRVGEGAGVIKGSSNLFWVNHPWTLLRVDQRRVAHDDFSA